MHTIVETREASSEPERILREYAHRRDTIPADFYSLHKPANLFMHQQRARTALTLLHRSRLPLQGRRVLEVGCGSGGWLPDFEAWGVRREDLAGIDLDPARVETAKARLSANRDDTGKVLSEGADLRCGDAARLPWTASAFDVALASTVFSSVFDIAMRRAIASEMIRVLKPGGVVIWYDFFVNNPANPNVRGVRRHEIEALFPGCSVRLSRITLAPPIARRLAPLSWGLARTLETLKVLNTHYLGLIAKA